MNKDQLADVLMDIATLLELKGENPFKTRAYQNAARAIDTLDEPLDKLISENRLAEVPGIGDAINKKVIELVTTGKLAYYEELKASIPPGELTAKARLSASSKIQLDSCAFTCRRGARK